MHGICRALKSGKSPPETALRGSEELACVQVMHDKLLAKVLELPMAFFDTQPSGRLVARFTHDVETTDIDLQVQRIALLTASVL